MKQIIKSNHGFTLVELLVAMVILLLIVFAFTPLLVGSIERIHYAGDKSEMLYQGQSEIEGKIAESITGDPDTLVLKFQDNPDVTIEVTGGLVDVLKEKGQASAWLSGFVPYVPSINLFLSPLPLVEGYNEIKIIIMGRDTKEGEDFDLAKAGITTIYDKHGFKAEEPLLLNEDIISELPENGFYGDYNVDSIPDDYDQYAVFTLSEGLKNSLSPYMPTIQWSSEDEDGNIIDVFVHTSLQVVLPYAAAVGSGQRLWVSPDANSIWKLRSQMGSGLGTLNDIVWTGFEYAAVSTTGRIAVWSNNEEPKLSDQSFSGLNSITYGNGQLVAVSDTGQVINSYDGSIWTANKITDNKLNTIGWSDDNIFIAAGENGTIWSSTDGISWIDESPIEAGSVSFNGVAYNGYWLAVGAESGQAVIYSRSVTGSTGSWEKRDIILPAEINTFVLPGLNDIIYDGLQFIAVGDGGTIVKSSDGLDGLEWAVVSIANNNNLNAIARGTRVNEALYYVIVGDSGTIITWDAAAGWQIKVGVGEYSVMGVAIR